MIQNGGRNGISLTAGFRWALGKEGKPIEKVQSPITKISKTTNPTQITLAPVPSQSIGTKSTTVSQSKPARKIIKQMSMEQKVAKGLVKPQNTTITTTKGTLKQL